MTQISDAVTVRCPYHRVPDFLTAYFGQLGAVGGTGASMPITVPVGEMTLQREVLATFEPEPGFPRYERMKIGWKPKHGGPYPDFLGTMLIESAGGDSSRIELTGKYEAPFGVAGKAFDATVGHRIAQAAARSLLAELKRELEQAYREEEEAVAKLSPRYPPTYE
jgi:hypothetical protein